MKFIQPLLAYIRMIVPGILTKNSSVHFPIAKRVFASTLVASELVPVTPIEYIGKYERRINLPVLDHPTSNLRFTYKTSYRVYTHLTGSLFYMDYWYGNPPNRAPNQYVKVKLHKHLCKIVNITGIRLGEVSGLLDIEAHKGNTPYYTNGYMISINRDYPIELLYK